MDGCMDGWMNRFYQYIIQIYLDKLGDRCEGLSSCQKTIPNSECIGELNKFTRCVCTQAYLEENGICQPSYYIINYYYCKY